jgi:hypothetical protein
MTPISPDQYETVCFTCGACVGKPWVGLTHGELAECQSDNPYQVYRAIEAKLKEKNGG